MTSPYEPQGTPEPQRAPEPQPAEPGTQFTPDSGLEQRRPAIRLGTIVWGAVLVAIAVGILALAAGATIDFELTAIVGLVIAGLALVIGSAITAGRRNSRERKRFE